MAIEMIVDATELGFMMQDEDDEGYILSVIDDPRDVIQELNETNEMANVAHPLIELISEVSGVHPEVNDELEALVDGDDITGFRYHLTFANRRDALQFIRVLINDNAQVAALRLGGRREHGYFEVVLDPDYPDFPTHVYPYIKHGHCVTHLDICNEINAPHQEAEGLALNQANNRPRLPPDLEEAAGGRI